MSALLVGSVAATAFLGFRYSGDAACLSGDPGPVVILAPIPDGKEVTLREAVRGTTFPVLLPPEGDEHVEAWLATDGRTVAFGIESQPDLNGRIETIYIKEFDRPRRDRDAYLDRSLAALPQAIETEISGVRAVTQPTCSALEPPQRIGPRLRTGTLYLYGGPHLSQLENIAEEMLRRPVLLPGVSNPRPSPIRGNDRSWRAYTFHHRATDEE